jgi:magnesium-transporting ATPase (P-type)
VWIAILVLQSIAENSTLNGPIQYGSQKKGLIVLVVVAVIIQLIADCLAVRKRRGWEENRMSYKVYHHNGKMAEWVNVKAHEIQPGHLYKVVPGECAPTDCVLIHSDHSLVHIKENHIISYLVESPSDVIIKETLLKGESVNLPFSGSLTY